VGLEFNEGRIVLDVGTLAETGATALVTAMATDAWTQVRVRVARLLGRGDAERERAALDELDETYAALEVAIGDDESRDVQVELRALLRARLRSDQELAVQFLALIEDVREQLGQSTQPVVLTQRAAANQGGTVIQSGRDSIVGSQPSREWRQQ
jgi:hypothetical protein